MIVGGQQIVVARHRDRWPQLEHRPDLIQGRHELGVAIWQPETALRRGVQVAALDVEHVEVDAEPGPGMQLPTGSGDGRQQRVLSQVGGLQGPARRSTRSAAPGPRGRNRPPPARSRWRPRPPSSGVPPSGRWPAEWPKVRTTAPRSGARRRSPSGWCWSTHRAGVRRPDPDRQGRAPGQVVARSSGRGGRRIGRPLAAPPPGEWAALDDLRGHRVPTTVGEMVGQRGVHGLDRVRSECRRERSRPLGLAGLAWAGPRSSANQRWTG